MYMRRSGGIDMDKVEVGKKYRNVHTNIECRVASKIFFNIKHYSDNAPGHPTYTHYKTFRKHWVEVSGEEMEG